MTMRNKEIIFNIIAVIIGIIFLFPLYWIIITSFKSDKEIFNSVPTLFPKEFTLAAYTNPDSGDYSLFKAFLNSLIVGVGCLVITLTLAIPSAYALARFNVKGKSLILQSFLLCQMLPASLLLTPLFIIYNKMGILNTYLAPMLSISAAQIPFIIIILRTYYMRMPKELEESATIDGCNIFTAFTKIIIPVSKPGIIMAATFSFLAGWSDLIYSLTFINKDEMRPITAGIYNFIG